MMKKLFVLTLALIMVLGMVQIPASAATTAIFDANFNADGNTLGAQLANTNYRTGEVLSRSFSIIDDSDATTYKGGISRSMTSSITLEQRAAGDNAVKFVSVYGLTNEGGRQENFVSVEPNYVVPTGAVMHFGFDFMAEDFNVFKSVSLKTNAYGWLWDFVKFNTDGTITLHDKSAGTYSLNTWYKFDIYYDTTSKAWYLFINDEFAKRIVKSVAMDKFITIRLEGTFDSETDASTTFWFDDLNLSFEETTDLAAVLPHYYNGFDSLTANKAFNASNGVTSSWSGGPSFANETYGKGSGSISAKISSPANSTINVVEKSAGNNVLQIHSQGGMAESCYIHASGVGMPFGAGDVVKLAFDFKVVQPNIKTQLFVRTLNNGNNNDFWDFIEFETNGVLYIFNNPAAVYSIDTWYSMEAYYNWDTQMWYFYLNDEFVYSIKRNLSGQSLEVSRFTWGAPEGKETDVYVDEFIVDAHPTRYASFVNPAAPAETTFTAVKNVADGGKNVFVRVKTPETISGKIIAVLYDGTELAEVQVKNASERAYITFKENYNNAKVMWWSDVEKNIVPKAEDVEIDFAN